MRRTLFYCCCKPKEGQKKEYECRKVAGRVGWRGPSLPISKQLSRWDMQRRPALRLSEIGYAHDQLGLYA